MFELMNTIHNDIDGTYCYGMLQYAGTEYGSRGQICVYRCSQCGREIRNLEESFAPAHGSSYGAPHGGMRHGGGHRDRDYGSGFGPAFGTGFNSGFNPGFGSGFGFGAGAVPAPAGSKPVTCLDFYTVALSSCAAFRECTASTME